MLVIQSVQSPHVNINDLGFFASLKSRFWEERFSTVDDLVEEVKRVINEYDTENFKRVWQSLFKRYNQALRGLGGNEFEVEHTETKRRQREDALPTLVPVGQEAHKRALNRWIDGVE